MKMPRAALCARLLSLTRLLLLHLPVRTLKWIGWSLLGIVTAFAALWQGYAIPHLNDHRPMLEKWLSHNLNLPVHIQTLDAGWNILFPEIRIHGLCLDAPNRRCAVSAAAVHLSVEWWAPWRAYRLYIDGPQTILQRERDGRFTFAGMPLHAERDSDPTALIERLLEQRHIKIERGTLIWNDLTGRTRPLRLTDLNASFDNTWRHKRLRFNGRTSPAISAMLEGDFVFRPLGFRARVNNLYGQGHLSLPKLDLAAWTPYVSEFSNPIHKGLADLDFSFDIQRGRLRYLKTHINLQKLEGKLNKETISLHKLTGNIMWSESGDAQRGYRGLLTTHHLNLNACPACPDSPINIETRLHYQTALSIQKAFARIDSLDLPSVSLLAQHIPLPRPWRSQLQRRLIEGRIDRMEAHWDAPQPPYLPNRFNGRIHNVGWRSLETGAPSVQGLTANVEGTPEAGTITLNSPKTRISWPWLWKELPEAALKGQILWSKKPHWQLNLDTVRVNTVDGNFMVHGTLAEPHPRQPDGWMQLKGSLALNQAPRLMTYLPLTLPKGLLEWLKMALQAGHGGGEWQLQGAPPRFPFLTGSANEYIRFDLQAKQATLRYAPDWPDITNMDSRIVLRKNRIDVVAQRARIGQLNLHPATASLTGIGTPATQLDAQASAQGTVPAALHLLRRSPLHRHVPDFLDHPDTQGQISSTMALRMPIENPADIRLESRSQFEHAQAPLPDLPPLKQGTGSLTLTEQGLVQSDFRAHLNGEPIQFTLTPHATDGLNLQAEGDLTPQGVAPWISNEWQAFFKGRSRWTLAAHLGSHRRHYVFNSRLKGLSSELPAPLNKTADTEIPMQLQLERLENKPAVWWVNLPETGLQARWSPPDTPQDTLRGHILLGHCRPQPSLPLKGWHFSGQLDGEEVDLLGWWNKRSTLPVKISSVSTPEKAAWRLPDFPLRIDLNLSNMEDLHPLLNEGVLRWTSADQQAQARLSNAAMNTQLTWNTQNSTPAIRMHFAYLNLSPLEKPVADTANAPAFHIQADHPPLGLPPLDISVNRLRYGNLDLGRLTIHTHTEEGALLIPTFRLSHEDSTFNAEGYWSSLGLMHWQGTWQFENTGNFLRRMKLYDGLKNGSGTITGALQWEGLAPLSNPKSLGGSVDIDFKNGQFMHVEPGIAKLLGLSSLQALPKRLALDFRDIFSEGFLFNRVTGRLNFERALLRSNEPIILEGDSANLRIHGHTDLVHETQNFNVRVIPNLSGSIAAATAFFINPLVGGATFFAQKVLQDPFEKAFSYNYSITGTWTHPMIKSTPRLRRIPEDNSSS